MADSPDDLAARLGEMTQELRRLEGLLDGWTVGGQSYFSVPYFRADAAEFVYPPWNVGSFSRTTTQAISSAVWTAIGFDSIDNKINGIAYSTASTGLFQFTAPSDYRVFLLSGSVHWNNTGGGVHGIKVVSYPSTAETIMSQVSGNNVAQSFGYFYRVPPASTAFDVQLYSQSIPNISSASLNVWEITRK